MKTRIWNRCVPLWLVVIALAAFLFNGFMAGQRIAEHKHAAAQHCPIISRQEVEGALGLHKHVIEQVNGETCSFVSSYGYPVLGVSRMEDVRGELFAQLSEGADDPADVPSAAAAKWVPQHKGLYFKANSKLVVINSDGTTSEDELLKLAAIIATQT